MNYYFYVKVYIYIYCLIKAPRSFLKYQMYCNLHNKQMDVNLLKKILYINRINL